LGNLKGRAHLVDIVVDGKIKSMLRKQDVRVWTGFTWLRIEPILGLL
jgi:hypothetical protein